MNVNDPRNCLTFNLQRAARVMARRMEAALAPVDLSAQQFSALARLYGHGSLPTSQLAELTGTERTTVTRNLARLEARGLIQPDDTETDRRINAWDLTETGRALIQEAFPLWRAAQADALAEVKGIEADAFLTALKNL